MKRATILGMLALAAAGADPAAAQGLKSDTDALLRWSTVATTITRAMVCGIAGAQLELVGERAVTDATRFLSASRMDEGRRISRQAQLRALALKEEPGSDQCREAVRAFVRLAVKMGVTPDELKRAALAGQQ